ncbi:MAG TPA: YceI family protein [Solirubrobacteraceae bacterium]|nr:YceI family protein [Solirubrobacteraceae bacterium]
MLTHTPTPLLPTGTYTIDPSTSSVGFSVRHLGVATVKGRFEQFEGELTIHDDGHVTATGGVLAATVESGSGIRDRRLRDEFFQTADHPVIAFTADATPEPTKRGKLHLDATLTIRGTTRPVELELKIHEHDLRIEATGEISQEDFSLEWDASGKPASSSSPTA